MFRFPLGARFGAHESVQVVVPRWWMAGVQRGRCGEQRAPYHGSRQFLAMQDDARRLRLALVVLGLQLLRARRPRSIHGLQAGEASNQ